MSAEPLLAARTVALANSAWYNPGGRLVSDVPKALVRIGFGKLRAPGTHRLHLPALEGETGLDALLDEIVVACAPVLGDRAWGGGGTGHGPRIVEG